MPDWAYVQGTADECGDPDHDEHHDPAGHCGVAFDYHHGQPFSTCGEQDAEWGVRQPSTPTCNHCGSTGVKWRLADGGGWRLFNTQREHPGNRYVLHDCRVAPSADDFDVLP